jgi:hypothetical protein
MMGRGWGMGMVRRRPSLGRYDLAGAREPAQYGRPASSANVRVAVGAVPDPLEPKARLLAKINVRTDILELERSKKLISESAYQTGRILQWAWEQHVGSGNQWSEGDRVDAAAAHDAAIVRLLETAQRVNAIMVRATEAVGIAGTGLLRRIIGDGLSYAVLAREVRQKGGERATAAVAAHFRMTLEALAEAWAARGAERARMRRWVDEGKEDEQS